MKQQRIKVSQTTRRKRAVRSGLSLLDKIVLGLLVFLFAWLTLGPFGLWRLHRLRLERDRLIALEIDSVKKNQMLKKRIRLLKEDKDVQERLVRSKLGWVRNNEILYVFHEKK